MAILFYIESVSILRKTGDKMAILLIFDVLCFRLRGKTMTKNNLSYAFILKPN